MDTIKNIFNELIVVLEDETKIDILGLDSIDDLSDLTEERYEEDKTTLVKNIISDKNIGDIICLEDVYNISDTIISDGCLLEYIEVFKDWEAIDTIIDAYNEGLLMTYDSKQEYIEDILINYDLTNIPNWLSIDYDHTFKELSYDFYTYEERYNGLFLWFNY